jgi:hypothetical protein
MNSTRSCGEIPRDPWGNNKKSPKIRASDLFCKIVLAVNHSVGAELFLAQLV